MSLVEIDTSRVQWPNTPAVKVKVQDYIRSMARSEGYRYFATMTSRCLNGIESPSPDPSPPPGWEYLEYFHDCEPEKVDDESAVFPDVWVVARKDSPLN